PGDGGRAGRDYGVDAAGPRLLGLDPRPRRRGLRRARLLGHAGGRPDVPPALPANARAPTAVAEGGRAPHLARGGAGGAGGRGLVGVPRVPGDILPLVARPR